MKNKYVFVTLLLLVLALAGFGFTRGYTVLNKTTEEQELNIVTSFYPMYIAAINIVGDCEGVHVENLSEPQTGCLHDYQLTPQDMILLSEADIFVVNGGGIEEFLTEVAQQYPELVIVEAGAGIFAEDHDHELEEVHEEEEAHDHDLTETHEEEEAHEHDHGENAHAWMSIPHYMEQVETIMQGLMAADSAHAKVYQQQAEAYLEKIQVLNQEAWELAESIRGENIIILHEAFEFLAEDYGIQVAGELNLDEERQVSAGEVADIINVIETKNIKIILAEDLYGKDMGDTIEKETECKVYYLDTLVRGEESKDSWLLGMEENIQILKAAFEIKD